MEGSSWPPTMLCGAMTATARLATAPCQCCRSQCLSWASQTPQQAVPQLKNPKQQRRGCWRRVPTVLDQQQAGSTGKWRHGGLLQGRRRCHSPASGLCWSGMTPPTCRLQGCRERVLGLVEVLETGSTAYEVCNTHASRQCFPRLRCSTGTCTSTLRNGQLLATCAVSTHAQMITNLGEPCTQVSLQTAATGSSTFAPAPAATRHALGWSSAGHEGRLTPGSGELAAYKLPFVPHECIALLQAH
jgi:hypothetical protein